MKVLNRIAISLIALLWVLSTGGCSDELTYPEGIGEGRKVTISIPIDISEPVKLSRSDMDANDLNRVETLWVGIYSASTGKRTYSTSGDKRYRLGFVDVENLSDTHQSGFQLENIETVAGKSYVVAVGNPHVASGMKLNDDGTISESEPLMNLLNDADTWEDFQRIILSRDTYQGAANIFNPNAPLPMCGVYYEGTTNHGIVTWDDQNFKPVDISRDDKTLSGAIHLRRTFSYIKFNIKAAAPENSEEEIISIEPISYQIFNVPSYTWLLDRKVKDTGTGIEYANAGDNVDPDKFVNNPAYPASLSFPSSNIHSSDGVFSFDFWQMENKRTGRLKGTSTTGPSNYAKRELEYKTGTGSGPGEALNSGIFTTLSPVGGSLNNLATYVDIKCNVTYLNGTSDNDYPPNTVPVGDRPIGATRTAEVVYRIHLGYVTPERGQPNANDFNCRRNSSYTYNVTVTSVKNIIVEAYRMGEKQPGAEGTVVDVTEKMVDLDSHFGQFNVWFTKGELENFSYVVKTYDGGTEYSYASSNGTIPFDRKYHDWVEIVPTNSTDPETTVAYPGRQNVWKGGDKPADLTKCLFRFDQFKTAFDNGYFNDLPKDEKGNMYFTVFVNEYTYEDDKNESNSKNWINYVRQPNRQVLMNVTESVSGDNNSSYYKAKYALSQKSIQTYYNLTGNASGTALGMESEDENYGMDIRWTWVYNSNDVDVTTSTKYLSSDNGRYNVWQYLTHPYTFSETGGEIASPEWSNYVVVDKLQKVNTINNAIIKRDPKLYNVPMLSTFSESERDKLTPWSRDELTTDNKKIAVSSANEYDPQIHSSSAQYIQAINSCMNRNRDENGNGIIDPEELKWYLPTSGKYMRVIMGRNSLFYPIMNYNIGNLPYSSDRLNNMYHFATSDCKILWAEQGIATSWFVGRENSYPYSCAPWQVRCIRNFGTDLSDVTPQDKVQPAYSYETDAKTRGGVVKIVAYYGNALRDAAIDALPLHKLNDQYNRLSLYGFEIAPIGNKVEISGERSEATVKYNSSQVYISAINDATPCADMEKNSGRRGGRVPTQKELAIMLRMETTKASATGGSTVIKMLEMNDRDYMMSCTSSFWGFNGATVGDSYGLALLSAGCGIMTVRHDGATRIEFKDINLVRCVRDITAAEANKSYQEIFNYKTN